MTLSPCLQNPQRSRLRRTRRHSPNLPPADSQNSTRTRRQACTPQNMHPSRLPLHQQGGDRDRRRRVGKYGRRWKREPPRLQPRRNAQAERRNARTRLRREQRKQRAVSGAARQANESCGGGTPPPTSPLYRPRAGGSAPAEQRSSPVSPSGGNGLLRIVRLAPTIISRQFA